MSRVAVWGAHVAVPGGPELEGGQNSGSPVSHPSARVLPWSRRSDFLQAPWSAASWAGSCRWRPLPGGRGSEHYLCMGPGLVHLRLSLSSWKPADASREACSARDLPVGIPVGERLPPPTRGPRSSLTCLDTVHTRPRPAEPSGAQLAPRPAVSDGLGQLCSRPQTQSRGSSWADGISHLPPSPPQTKGTPSGVFPGSGQGRGQGHWAGLGGGSRRRWLPAFLHPGTLGLLAAVTREARAGLGAFSVHSACAREAGTRANGSREGRAGFGRLFKQQHPRGWPCARWGPGLRR